jgi:NADH-ubiquinone oxidoreductase chain 6
MRLLAPAFKFHFKEGRRTMILSVLSSPALVSGLMVVRAKNPVHSVLFPILVFCDTSGLLILLGLDFSAMIFPVVHIGAIAVSFLFVVMMFNIQIAEIHEEVLRYLPVSGIIGLIFWWEMFFILDNETIPLLPTHRNTTSLGYTVYAGKVRSWTNLETLGNLLYTYYSVWFLVSSLILLVAMIGAIVLTMHRTTKVKRQDVFRRNALDSRRTIIVRPTISPLNLMNRRRLFSSSSGGSGVIPVRLRFSDTLPQARQPISHRRVHSGVSELLLAVAPYVPEMAEHIVSTVQPLFEDAAPLEAGTGTIPPLEAGTGTSSSSGLLDELISGADHPTSPGGNDTQVPVPQLNPKTPHSLLKGKWKAEARKMHSKLAASSRKREDMLKKLELDRANARERYFLDLLKYRCSSNATEQEGYLRQALREIRGDVSIRSALHDAFGDYIPQNDRSSEDRLQWRTALRALLRIRKEEFSLKNILLLQKDLLDPARRGQRIQEVLKSDLFYKKTGFRRFW